MAWAALEVWRGRREVLRRRGIFLSRWRELLRGRRVLLRRWR